MRESIEWHFFDTDSDTMNDAAWARQAIAEPQDESRFCRGKAQGTTGHMKTRYLYELLIGIALCYGVVVYFIWQQTAQHVEQKMEDLARDVMLLQQDLAEIQATARPPHVVVDETDRPQLETRTTLPHYFETDHLRFVVSARVNQLAQQVAPQIDTAYERLGQEFGLASNLFSEKLTIFIDSPINGSARAADEKVFFISDPQATAKRYGIKEADALTTELLVRLAPHLIERAAQKRVIKPQWQSMVLALQTHVQLEYGFAKKWQQQRLALLYRHQAQRSSLNLVHDQTMHYATDGQRELLAQPSPIANATANPLVEFILNEYGYSKVSTLLDAFEEYESWETLVPNIFHISASEFEERWHVYLSVHYPLPME